MSDAANDNARPNAADGAAWPSAVRLWYNSKQAALMVGVSDVAFKSLVFRGRIIPDHRGGQDGLKSHRFTHETLAAFVDSRKKHAR